MVRIGALTAVVLALLSVRVGGMGRVLAVGDMMTPSHL